MPDLVSLAIALAVTLGVPLSLGAGPFGSRRSLGARWWAGFLIATVPLVVLHGLGVPRAIGLGAIALAAVAALVFRLCRRRARTAVVDDPKTAALSAFHALIAVLILIAALHTFVQPVVQWDAVVVWWAKARDLEAWRRFAELVRPAYPDLGPMAWSVVTTAAGGLEPAGRIVFPIAAMMALLALTDLAPGPINAANAGVLATLAVLFYGADAFTSGYQDAFLAAAIGVSAIALVSSLSSSAIDKADVLRGFATAGALGLIKSEGAPIGLAIVIAYTIVSVATAPLAGRRDSLRVLMIPVVSVAVLAAIWPVMLLAHGIGLTELQEGSFSAAGIVAIPSRLGDRLPQIGHQLLVLAGDSTRFVGLIVISVAGIAAMVALRRELRPEARRRLAFLTLLGTFHFVLVLMVFLATEAPLAWHLDTALLRLLLHMRFVLAAFVAIVAFELVDIAHRPTARNE